MRRCNAAYLSGIDAECLEQGRRSFVTIGCLPAQQRQVCGGEIQLDHGACLRQQANVIDPDALVLIGALRDADVQHLCVCLAADLLKKGVRRSDGGLNERRLAIVGKAEPAGGSNHCPKDNRQGHISRPPPRDLSALIGLLAAF